VIDGSPNLRVRQCVSCFVQLIASYGRYLFVLWGIFGLCSFGVYVFSAPIGLISGIDLNEVAFKFGPAEYFALLLLGIIVPVVIVTESLIKAIGMVFLGLLLGLVGVDVNSGTERYSFGIPELLDGLNYLMILIGLSGFSGVIFSLGTRNGREAVFSSGIKGLLLRIKIYRRIEDAILSGVIRVMSVVPYRWLFPAIVLFCAIGVYSTNNNTFDIWMVAIFGVIGYLFIKLGMEPAPLLLGFILGPMMEENLRRALLLSRGDWSVFITRGLSASLLAVAALLLIIVLLPSVSKKREEAFVEE
jgi:TctA family transporter